MAIAISGFVYADDGSIPFGECDALGIIPLRMVRLGRDNRDNRDNHDALLTADIPQIDQSLLSA